MTSLALAAVLAVAQPVAAQTPVEWLFETPHLDGLSVGTSIEYSYQSQAPDLTEGTVKTEEQKLVLTIIDRVQGQTPKVDIVQQMGGKSRKLDTFQGVPGNPMLLVFLERVVVTLHEATGGSPFYLRNRVKEALGMLEQKPDAIGAGDIVLTALPFQNDRNRARLGPFANMELTFRLNPERSGMLVKLSALAGDGEALKLIEEIRLDTSP